MLDNTSLVYFHNSYSLLHLSASLPIIVLSLLKYLTHDSGALVCGVPCCTPVVGAQKGTQKMVFVCMYLVAVFPLSPSSGLTKLSLWFSLQQLVEPWQQLQPVLLRLSWTE